MTTGTMNLSGQRRAEVEALVKANGGQITPHALLDFASDPTSALHDLFTWDDTEAAQKYRELQATRYLRAIVKLIPRGENEAPMRVRAYVADADGQHTYRPVVEVMSTEAGRAALLSRAMRELQAFRAKYAELQELAQVFAALEQVATPQAA